MMVTTWRNGLLLLEFNNVSFTGIGDSSGLPAAAAAGNLYISLHTADPGVAGDQTTNEVAYTNYDRVAVPRTSSGWTVTANEVVPVNPVQFPQGGVGASPIAAFFGIGTDPTGAGKLLRKGPLSPNITLGNGVTPVPTITIRQL